ncbi:CGP-CTERM-anchored Cys-rich protein [Pyrococcus sp. ST04]|uniref:CGP-CTERM-anchored Cys-rich protein n=1 Tax=Pyrococcus sp. ST04 TaxID=1183377 RepID=UPI0002605C25|nr:CGP-CTERM-anchored Cys-rich protein [Pyrococcus sp. ST04]AFK22345.1 hypothetical protein Py04_0744 [Pyrococcus sp. ST04]
MIKRSLIPTALSIILILTLMAPLSEACFFPQDLYAVEVELTKIKDYNLAPLLSAKNVLIEEDGKIVYRSHYDERLAVIVWKDKEGKLHVRVQIPTERKIIYEYEEIFTAVIPLEDVKERAKRFGWYVEGNRVEKENLTIIFTPLKGKECNSDLDCKVSGCSGEVCAPRNKTIYSICIYREWYKCLNLTSCGCYNGFCTWKPNKEFLSCLKSYNVSLEEIIQARTRVKISIRGEELGYGEIEELKRVLGCNVPRNFTRTVIDIKVIPKINPDTLNAGKAIEKELKWLRSIGVIKINDSDIEKIVKVAKWGYAGYNSRIGFYDDKWIPYSNASNAVLIRCGGLAYEEYNLPPSTPIVNSTRTEETPTREVCGPGVILLLIMLGGVRRK